MLKSSSNEQDHQMGKIAKHKCKINICNYMQGNVNSHQSEIWLAEKYNNIFAKNFFHLQRLSLVFGEKRIEYESLTSGRFDSDYYIMFLSRITRMVRCYSGTCCSANDDGLGLGFAGCVSEIISTATTIPLSRINGEKKEDKTKKNDENNAAIVFAKNGNLIVPHMASGQP